MAIGSLEILQEYDFKIVHQKGKVTLNADAHSCLPYRQCGRHELVPLSIIDTTTPANCMTEMSQYQKEDNILQPVLELLLFNKTIEITKSKVLLQGVS